MGIARGRKVTASYNPSEIAAYSHSAFIEALPPIMSVREVVNKLKRLPAYREDDRGLLPEVRLQLVQTLKNYVEPLPVHLDLERRVSRMIRNGYMSRNPITAEWKRQLQAGFRNLVSSDREHLSDDGLPVVRSNADGFAILGASGVGKTTAIESILGLYPQVIYHSEYNGHAFSHQQLVWLKLGCPHNGSIKSLCLNFFQEIDALLDTRYYAKNSSPRKSVEELVPVMAGVASALGLGVLIIDEIQRLSAAKSGGDEQMLNFFVRLVNTVSVPVVLVGTYRALPILGREFSQARRAAGQGDLIWAPFSEDETWDYLIEQIWKYQWTNVPSSLSKEIRKALYFESAGIIDFAIKLYMLAQWQVIGTGDERITSGVIHRVAKESLQLAQPILSALRNNDTDRLRKIRDIAPAVDSLDRYLAKASHRITLEGALNTMRNQQLSEKSGDGDRMADGIIRWLIEAGIDFKIASKATEITLAAHQATTDVSVVRRDAYDFARGMTGDQDQTSKQPALQKKGRGARKLHKTAHQGLIQLFEEALSEKTAVSEVFRNKGMMRPASELLGS